MTVSKHRPSLSSSMQWISAKSRVGPLKAQSPTRISEPKLIRTIDILTHPNGVLGSGAQIVKTPEDAFRDSDLGLLHPDPIQILPPLASPPLPPIPSEEEEEIREFKFPRNEQPVPHDAQSISLPILHTSDSNEPILPPFKPILLSNHPDRPVDRSQVLVTLETCTTTYKTTFDTITCRPSHLSRFIEALFPRTRTESTTSSVYSTSSDDDNDDDDGMSTFKAHLASQGLLAGPPAVSSTTSLHIFLDRPSAPYSHILAYLRAPATLPRAVLLHPNSSERLQLLLDLRDEASFLDLQHLYNLCTDEINPPYHHRSASSIDASTLHNSDESHLKPKQSPPAGWF